MHCSLLLCIFSLANPLLTSATWTPVYSVKEIAYSSPNLLCPDPPSPIDSLPAAYFTSDTTYNVLNPPVERYSIQGNLSESSTIFGLVGNPFSQNYSLALDMRSSEIAVLGTNTCETLGINSSMCFDPAKYIFVTTQSKKLTCTDQLESLAFSASFNTANRQRATKVRLIQKASKPASWWNPAQGRFGLSPYFLTCGDRAIPTFYDILTGVDSNTPVEVPDYTGFGLSVDGADGGVLHLNGVSPPDGSVIYWSQISSVAAPVCIYNWSDKVSLPSAIAAHYGVLYGLSVCNVDLLGGLMQSHGFTVDLREPCLVLPATFFNMLTTWIPATCQSPASTASLGNDGPIPLPCNITDGTDPNVWADLKITFQLTPGGEKMPIPLRDLVFDYPDGQKGLCIKSAGLPLSMSSVQLLLSPLEAQDLPEGGPALASRDIVLGSRALRNLYVAYDYASGRIGLSAKDKANGTSTCATTTKICSGKETYYQPLNTCLPPICTSYLFQQLNADKSSCEFTQEAKYLLIALAGLLVAWEFIQGVIYVRFVQQAQTL